MSAQKTGPWRNRVKRLSLAIFVMLAAVPVLAQSSREAQARQREASSREAQARQREASSREAQARQREASSKDSLADLIQAGNRKTALDRIRTGGADVHEAQPDGTRPIHWAVYRVDYE